MKTLAMDFRSGFFAKTCPYHVGLRLEAPLASCTAPLRMKPKTPSPGLSRDDRSTIRNDFSVVMGIAGCAGMPCDPRGRASDVPIEKPRHTRWNEGSGVTGPATHAPYVRRASAMRAQHRISTHVHTASELPSPPSPNDKTPPLRSVSPPQIFGKTKGRSFCFEIAKKKAKKQKWTFQGDTRLGRLFLLRVDKDGQPRGSLCPNSSFPWVRQVRLVSTEHELTSGQTVTGLYAACETKEKTWEAANAVLDKNDSTTFYQSLNLADLETYGDVQYLDLERYKHPGGVIGSGNEATTTKQVRVKKVKAIADTNEELARISTHREFPSVLGKRNVKQPEQRDRSNLSDLVAVCEACETPGETPRIAPSSPPKGKEKKNTEFNDDAEVVPSSSPPFVRDDTDTLSSSTLRDEVRHLRLEIQNLHREIQLEREGRAAGMKKVL